LRHLIKIIIAFMVISWLWRSGREMIYQWVERGILASHSAGAALPTTPFLTTSFSGVPSGEHFSPAENLERLDLAALASAQHSVDLCMYAFTDVLLARELIDRARHGVIVRIYRDGKQFEDEQERSSRYGWVTTAALLHGQTNIQIRVKPPSRQFIQHLKVYCVDGALLRDGSANFSRAGEEWEDDSANFLAGPAVCERFEEDFETLWNRPTNIVVQ
jgi:phosphatidylserine/phosphatidylglycerophosphate/cardiolipin synthase-like enzyme